MVHLAENGKYKSENDANETVVPVKTVCLKKLFFSLKRRHLENWEFLLGRSLVHTFTQYFTILMYLEEDFGKMGWKGAYRSTAQRR